MILSALLKKFDFQFLKAVRDVERDMYTGNNSLLKDVIDFFIDKKSDFITGQIIYLGGVHN